MKRMFEAVVFGGAKLFWDYRHRNTGQYKGYYHWHQCCEMLFVHEGTGHVVVGGDTFPIRRGMLFFFRPYQLHHVYANVSPEQPYTRTIFHFDPQLADDLLGPFARRHGLFTALCQGRYRVQAFDLMGAEEAVERNFDDYDRSRQEGKGEETEEIGMLILRLLDTVIRCDHSGLSRSPGTLERKSTGYVQQAMRWIDGRSRRRHASIEILFIEAVP